MKTALFATLFSLMAGQAFAASQFVCEGFADVEEYRSNIDLTAKTADFFDNDATSEMTLKAARVLESNPPQFVYIFEGPEANYSGTLRLSFNKTRQHASLESIDKNGKVSQVGEANCKPVK